MTYREVIRDTVRVRPKHVKSSGGDCGVSKHDFRAMEKFTHRPLNGMGPTGQESGRGLPISRGRSGRYKNIHTTPTKASHAGMPPTLLKQANDKCDQLVEQGVVSTTNSPWACKPFNVNNRAEQVRGKLRLVIKYKPLNHTCITLNFH